MTGDLPAFRRALLDHFERTRRPLPWRSERTPYRVMVSEFMLQRTRAETVIPYYERWVRRFPGWAALAGAHEDEVLREWAGLGYYRRARNLHRAAQIVRERFGGRLPEEPERLRELPGVGEYTAGAVASIAFARPVPAVDGNVRRVLCRLFDLEGATAARLRAEAARLLDPDRPGAFNEAMMEVGATVCTPRSPDCAACPVRRWCRAKAAGTVAERPARRPRRKARRADYAAVVAVAAGATLLVKRPDRGLLAGMWEFPSVELEVDGGGPGHRVVAEAALRRLEDFALHGRLAALLDPVPHTFTHLHAIYHPAVLSLPRPPAPGPRTPPLPIQPPGAAARRGPPAPATYRTAWADPSRLDEFALPVAQQKIAALLRSWLRGMRPRASG